ncbi:MAG: hydrogenase expression/formation protein [Candidatus Latescibacteria bacterium]|nr:hydrogenase expression/formation protein [Candidatus Latescibacterota bacterium]
MSEQTCPSQPPTFPTGKLPPEVLGALLSRYAHRDPRIVVGPSIGEDATVLDMGERYLVVTTDPITYATDEIGWYAVQVNANDIATMGATPQWFLATLLLPAGEADTHSVEQIFAQIDAAATDLGIVLCGGHTEITPTVNKPVLCGTMIGEVEKERLVRSSGLRPGDLLLLTKGLAVEATVIIAREKRELLLRFFSESFLDRCAAYLRSPGIGITQEARIACETGEIHAMHDPTEGGIATGLREVALASGVGLEIDASALFLTGESRILCEIFDLDPLGVISSGALLIGVVPDEAECVRQAIVSAQIRCDVIGVVRETTFGLKMRRDGELIDLPVFERDEITKISMKGQE